MGKQPRPIRQAPLIAGLLTAISLGGAAPAALAAFPGRDGLIAFTRTNRFGNQTLWTVNPRTRKLRPLTSVPAGCRKTRKSWMDDVPAFSASGRYVFYSHSGDCDRRLPDGLYRLRIRGMEGGAPELVLRDRDGLVTWWPAPSAHGTRLFFINDLPISPSRDRDEFSDTIYSVRLHGRARPRKLSPRGATSDEFPALSASGRILFSRDDHRLLTGGAGRTLPRGRRLRVLTTYSPGQFASSDWAPDGKSVVFERQPPGRGFHSDVYVIRSSGRGLRRITRAGDAVSPVWSPSGRWIAFSRSPDRHPTTGPLYVADRRGRHVRKVLNLIDETRLSWQPRPRGGG